MELSFSRPKTIIIKILGVITPVSFTDELLNYFKENVEQYLKSITKEEFLEVLNALKDEASKQKSENAECPSIDDKDNRNLIKSMIEYMIWTCKEKKIVEHSTVNEVQAVIWGEAFHSKKIKKSFYSDVLPKLKEWNKSGIKVFTMSHGTVSGQEAYMKYSIHGDISEYISGFIRLSYGSSYISYAKLSLDTETNKKEILLLTNKVEEAKNALLAGLDVCIVQRDINLTETNENLCVNGFAEITFKEPQPKKQMSSKIITKLQTKGRKLKK